MKKMKKGQKTAMQPRMGKMEKQQNPVKFIASRQLRKFSWQFNPNVIIVEIEHLLKGNVRCADNTYKSCTQNNNL